MLVAEETAIEHRHLEHRDLQTTEQGLHRVRHIAVIEDEIEQHADHIDHVLVDLIEALGRRVVRPHVELPPEVIQHLRLQLPDLCPAHRRLDRKILLQIVQGIDEFARPDRRQMPQVGRVAPTRQAAGIKVGRAVVAPHRQQLTQHTQDLFLADLITRMRCHVATGGVRHRVRGFLACTLHRGRDRIAPYALDDLWQHTAIDQHVVEIVIQAADVTHDITVEQLEHDQTHTEITRPLMHGGAEPLGKVERADRILPHRQVGQSDHLGETHVQCKQFAVIAVLGLGHHAVYREVLFELLVVDQTEFIVAGNRFRLIGRHGLLPERIVAIELVAQKSLFDRFTQLAQLAHGIEVTCLQHVAGRLVRELVKLVVDVLEQLLHQPRQGVLEVYAARGKQLLRPGITHASPDTAKVLFERNHIVTNHLQPLDRTAVRPTSLLTPYF